MSLKSEPSALEKPMAPAATKTDRRGPRTAASLWQDTDSNTQEAYSPTCSLSIEMGLWTDLLVITTT